MSTRLARLMSKAQGFSAMDWLILALLAAASFQYWFGLDPLVIALVEPVALLVLIFLCGLIPGQSDTAREPIGPLSWVWLGLSVWAVLSWLVAKDWRYGLNDVRQLVLASALFAALMARPDLRVRRIAFLLVAVAVLSALAADIQRLTGWFVPPFSQTYRKELLSPLEGAGVPVAEGFFRNGNVFAAFIFWPFLVCLAEAARGGRRVWGAVGVLLLGATLILSLGRGVMAGALLAGILLAVFLSRVAPRRQVGLAAGVTAVAIAAVAIVSATVPESGFFLTLGLRRTLWDAAIELMRRTPSFLITGVGAHTVDYLQGFKALGREDPHDLYLYMLVHYGAAGLVAIVLTVAAVVRAGWLSLRAEGLRDRPLLAALFAGWIAFWVMGLLDSYFTTAELRLLFVVMLSLFFKAGSTPSLARAEIDAPAPKG